MRRAGLFVAAAGCALLAACGSAGGSAPPTFEPSPSGLPSEGPGITISPIVPEPPGNSGNSSGGAGGSSSGGGSAGSSASSGSGSPAIDPAVVATRLTTPVGLSLLPDGTALVGERTTGRIVRVQPVAGRPVPVVKTVTGLDTAGGGGLLDLAVSPDYAQDNLIYAYVSTRTDNRVVEFTLGGPVTPVLTGIPHGRSGNAGRIVFDASGDLYVGTGLAGATGGSPKSLAGKVLRVNSIGKAAAGNPQAGSRVFTSGHNEVSGLCPVTRSTAVLEVEAGGANAEVNLLTPGANYGYPGGGSGARGPIASLPSSDPAPGDCAVQAGRLWVTSPDGRELLDAPLSATGTTVQVGKFGQALTKKYGRLLTVVPAADGALWLTTTNRDGHGSPVAADERVIRYVPSGGGGSGAPV